MAYAGLAAHHFDAEPAEDAGLAEQNGPADHAEPPEPAEHAAPADHDRPAKPKDVLEEFAALSSKLPEMPPVDYSNDLPGLFRAAFATCDELSPRKSGSRKSADEAEDLSLYDDADDALEEEGRDSASDGVALDASDDEEEERTVARPLLEVVLGCCC